MKRTNWRLALAAVLGLGMVGLAAPQIKEVIKIVGVGAAVKQFGPQINREINKLANFKDTDRVKTRVVPILSIGINTRRAVGAAQVMGPPSQVDKVEAVAMPELDLFGKEIKIRAMIPVDTQKNLTDIRRVDGVGVSGIVDLKL